MREQNADDIISCMSGKGFTPACATCTGAYANCVYSDCSTECADPTSAACESCYTTKCLPVFFTCSGLQAPKRLTAPEAKGACTDAADMAKANASFEKDLVGCFATGYTKDVIETCMEGKFNPSFLSS